MRKTGQRRRHNSRRDRAHRIYTVVSKNGPRLVLAHVVDAPGWRIRHKAYCPTCKQLTGIISSGPVWRSRVAE